MAMWDCKKCGANVQWIGWVFDPDSIVAEVAAHMKNCPAIPKPIPIEPLTDLGFALYQRSQ